MRQASAARERLIQEALAYLQAERDEGHAHSAASQEYHEEGLALAARDLVEATEALPRGERPVGWNTKPQGRRLPVSLSEEDLALLIGLLELSPSGTLPAERDLLRRLQEELAAFFRHPES